MSNSTIQAVIRSPASAGETLKRTNDCLAHYWEPDHDPKTKAGVREGFVRSLDQIPEWAMHKAFDSWERTMTRRPSPAEIVMRAIREITPFTDELAIRRRNHERAEAEQADRAANRITPEAAAEMLLRAGFTPKLMADLRFAPMATSMAAASERADTGGMKHWTEWATEGDKASLTKARDGNDAIRESRKSQAEWGKTP